MPGIVDLSVFVGIGIGIVLTYAFFNIIGSTYVDGVRDSQQQNANKEAYAWTQGYQTGQLKLINQLLVQLEDETTPLQTKDDFRRHLNELINAYHAHSKS